MTAEDVAASQPPTASEVASAFVDGEVGADQAAWVDAHRDTDAALTAEIDGFARVKGLLGGLGVVEPGDGGWEQMGAAVRREVAVHTRRTWAAGVSAAVAALVLVAAVALGSALFAGRSVPDTAPRATPAALGPRPTGAVPGRPGTGAVAAARGIGSVVERIGVSPRPFGSATSSTSTTSTRPPSSGFVPSR